jgi:hypothetical protein
MATLRVNEVPVPKPPVTYDILGLTEDEMELLVNLLGNTSGELSYRLYNTLPYGMFSNGYFTTNHIMRLKSGK